MMSTSIIAFLSLIIPYCQFTFKREYGLISIAEVSTRKKRVLTTRRKAGRRNEIKTI